MSDLIATGVIRASHGLEGYVKVASLSGEFEHFSSLKHVTLVLGDKRMDVAVENIRIINNAALFKFSGIDTVDAARNLRSWELWVPKSEAAHLADDEIYASELSGCSVYVDGEVVGRIIGTIDSSADLLIEIELSEGGVRMVPYRNEFFGNVDIEVKRVELIAPWVLA